MEQNNIVNVRSIGVVDNGLVDCSIEVNSFLSNEENNGKVLYFPKGKYYVKAGIVFNMIYDINIKCDNDAIIYIDRKSAAINIINTDKAKYSIVVTGLTIVGYSRIQYIKNTVEYIIKYIRRKIRW